MQVICQKHTDLYSIYNADCVEVCAGLPSNSIDFTIFSPPFSSLYTYSNSERDMGNSKDDEEFFMHFGYLVDHLFRLTKPGRIIAFHCMNIPAMKERDGYIGIKDFRGDLIRCFQQRGFIFHSEHCIWKDPLIEATRTKALGLMHKQLCKDSTICRSGLPDYLIAMRKPGENAEPVAHENGLDYFMGDNPPTTGNLSHERWRRYASPVWMDIRQTYTLNAAAAREEDDERHVCLSEGSLILTENGFKEIESVVAGEKVFTHNGNWKMVIAKACTGENPVVQTLAQGVPLLQTTPDHRIYSRRVTSKKPKRSMARHEPEWIAASENGKNYVNAKLPDIVESNLTNEDWWIVGRYLADGHRGGHVRKGMKTFYISIGKGKEGMFYENVSSKRIGFIQEPGCNTKQVLLKNIPSELKEMLHACGNGAHNKQIPIQGICLNAEKSKFLLDGYMSGDGWTDGKGNFTASSASRKLLLGLSLIIQRVHGVIASVYAGRKKRKGVIEGRIVNMAQEWVLTYKTEGSHTFGKILDDGAWKKVRKVEKKGIKITWAMQVEDDESYYAEGCFVKNCPLQLDTIERGIQLWSNPGNVVLSPFMGIGSEGYVAVKDERRFIGVELKESYYVEAEKNMNQAEEERKEQMLF